MFLGSNPIPDLFVDVWISMMHVGFRLLVLPHARLSINRIPYMPHVHWLTWFYGFQLQSLNEIWFADH